MKRAFLSLLGCSLVSAMAMAQVQLATTDLTGQYKYSTSSITPYGIHDPSVVWDPTTQYFYVYGSHYAGAKTTNLRNWTAVSRYYKGSYDSANAYKAFLSNPTHTVKRCLPGSTTEEEVTLGSYDAGAFASIYSEGGASQWISGNQWAPDIIYNPNSGKWNYYVSLNGDNWASVIVLMTSDSPTGPFTYEAPIVFGGFNNQSYTVGSASKKVDYKDTDLELVLGSLSSIPSRYRTSTWGNLWPNCIDPCVFFDEDGELWMSYGSWSGGIFMLKLDKQTGLRDYTCTYPATTYAGTDNYRRSYTGYSSDPYFGKLIAGGAYVSGEGSYIQHIGNYYYLFMSYGFFSPDGGYEMRIFRSSTPTGPYVDANGTDAISTSYQMNYGPNAATNKGMKILGSYNGWGEQVLGECAQGHNSACQDDKGRSYVVYHSKFTDNQTKNNAAHAMRVHQLFLNKQGWLCAAPFVFNGEAVNDDSIATTQPWSAADVEGDYHILVHPYKMDYENYAVSTPQIIHLSADGQITGDYTGTWKYTDDGKSYIQLNLGSSAYSGVVLEQTIQGTNTSYGTIVSSAKALCITAVCCTKSNANCGVPIWCYKMQPQYAIAYNYQQNTAIFKSRSVSKNVSIMFDPLEGTTLSWESSNPDVLSTTGKYNPDTVSVPVEMTARLECGPYFWTNTYKYTCARASSVTGDAYTGLVAYYNFDDKPTLNLYDDSQRATYGRSKTTSTAPTLETDYDRFGQVCHQYFAANGSNSYTRFPNPLCGIDSLTGFTVSLWVKRADLNYYDALWAFFNSVTASASGERLFYTGNSYLGYNDNQGNWFDVNNPDTKKVDKITVGEWCLVTVTYSVENGYKLYVNGSSYTTTYLQYAGSADKDTFDRSLVTKFVSTAKYFFLGLGSFWGSAEACFDDLMIYDRELSTADVRALNTLLNRVTDFSPKTVLPGDVNGDGEVTLADVTALTDICLGRTTSGYDLAACDLTGDGQITYADVIALISLCLGSK